jgi:Zn-dependent protease
MRERYWVRRGRVTMALAAGPVTYLLLCLATLAAYHAATDGSFGNASQILAAAATTFGGMTIVSLFPVPPLDLGRIIFTLAPPTHGWQQARYQLEDRNFGLIIALALLLLPQLLPGLPSVVGELSAPLIRHLLAIVS